MKEAGALGAERAKSRTESKKKCVRDWEGRRRKMQRSDRKPDYKSALGWKKHFLLPSNRACLQMTLQAGDSRALWHQAGKSGGTAAPSPGGAVGRGGSTNSLLRHKKQPVSTASLPAAHISRTCFPGAQGDVLHASLAGAVPLPAQGSSPGVSGHSLVESRWETKKNEGTEENRVSRTTVPGRRSSGFSQDFKGFSLKHLFY